jgi:hypothetical protein
MNIKTSSPGGEATTAGTHGSNTHTAKVKNARSYIYPPPHLIMAWYLVKHWYNFTFYSELWF